LASQFNTLMFPVVVRYGATDNPDALRRMLVEGTRLSVTLACGLTVCLIGFARPLITRWMGPGFEGAVAPLYVLAVVGVVLIGQGPLGNILLATGRHRLVAYVALADAVVNLALSVVLVRRFGLLGVAVGTAIPVFITNVFVLAPVVCRQLDIKFSEFGRAVVVAPMTGVVVSSVGVWVVRTAWPPQSLPAIIGEGAVVGVLYLASLWTLGLDRSLRATYSAFGRQLMTMATERRAAAPLV